MRAILQILLMIAVTFVYVPGARAAIEVSHSHEVSGGHGHEHHGDDNSHHSHDHGPVQSPESPENDLPDGDSHSHSHFVTLGGDTLFIPASFAAFMLYCNGACQPMAASITIPEEPCFSLIKPPQLG
jgi:hypothetical protein